jgi:hypothetical protein
MVIALPTEGPTDATGVVALDVHRRSLRCNRMLFRGLLAYRPKVLVAAERNRN